jgi:hypothetical protein
MADIDWSDPCARAEHLKKHRAMLVAGEIEEATSTGDSSVRFTRANISALDDEIARAVAQCRALQGRPRPKAGLAGFSRGDR